MRIAALVVALALTACLPAGARAQSADAAPTPVPIEEWSQAKVVAMGKEIFRQDTAAWQGTDALIAFLNGAQPTGLKGWIVEPAGNDQRVRFLIVDEAGTRAGWDVIVSERGAGAVTVPADGTLTAEELARFQARRTAMDNIGRLRCSRNLNTAVVDDPDSDGWLVWLLTSTTDANIVPMGGHYRFRISADGLSVLQRDMLTNGCLNMPRAQPGAQGAPVGLWVSQIVSHGPVETHVFLSLQNRMPIYVAAGDKLFEVNGVHIREVRR